MPILQNGIGRRQNVLLLVMVRPETITSSTSPVSLTLVRGFNLRVLYSGAMPPSTRHHALLYEDVVLMLYTLHPLRNYTNAPTL